MAEPGPSTLLNLKEPLGFFEKDGVKTATKCVRILVIGYAFKNDPLMCRITNFNSDLQNIIKTFEKYNCIVTQLIGLKKDDLLANLENEIFLKENFEIRDEENPELLIVFVLSHGEHDGVIFTDTEIQKEGIQKDIIVEENTNGEKKIFPKDYERFNKRDIWSRLSRIRFLENALKIYFLQPCRGNTEEQNYSLDKSIPLPKEPRSTLPNLKIEPNLPNHVFFYSTFEGNVAVFDSKGTWMVQAVCSVLRDTTTELSVEKFLTRIMDMIHKLSGLGNFQTPEMVLFPHSKFLFKSLSGTDAVSDRSKMRNTADDKYSWTTLKGEKLGPGRAIIFFDPQHQNLVEHFKKCFESLHLNVRAFPVREMDEILKKEVSILEEEGMILICCLCKLEKSDKGEVGILYDYEEELGDQPSTSSENNRGSNLSSVTGLFTSENCPQMNGRAKVFLFFDSQHGIDDISRKTVNVTTTNCGNAHSHTIVFIAKGHTDFCNDFLKCLKDKNKDLLQKLTEVSISWSKDSNDMNLPVIISTMPFLVDFPFIENLYIQPTFHLQNDDEQMETKEINFEELCRRMNNFSQSRFSKLTKERLHHIEQNQQRQDHVCDENEDDSDNRKLIYVLSCEPGTGKSMATKELIKFLKKNRIETVPIFAKQMKKSLTESANLRDLIAKHFKSVNDFKKAAFCFDGVDETCPRRREKLFLFLKEAVVESGFVWITTRPQENIKIKETLKGHEVSWLTIKNLEPKEEHTFVRRMLKDVDHWEETWDQIRSKLKIPWTPLLLELLAKLIKDDKKMNIFNRDLNMFIIFLNLVDQQVNQTITKHNLESSFLEVMLILIDASVRFMLNKGFDDFKDKDTINKVGLARFDRDKIEFIHNTYFEFMTSLAFLAPTGEVPNFDVADMVKILTEPQFLQVRSFLDEALQNDFKEKYFEVKRFVSNEELMMHLRGKGGHFLKVTCFEGRYNMYKKIALAEMADLFEDTKDELLYFACVSTNEKGEMIARDLLDKRNADFSRMMLKDINESLLLKSLVRKHQKIFLEMVPNHGVEKEALNQALFEAAKLGSPACLEILLKKGAEKDAKNEFGATALHCAVEEGKIEVVEMILEAGLDVNSRTKIGTTPLMIAAHRDELFVKVLLQNNADILAEDNQGRTALHYAAQQGNVAIMKTLLDLGAVLEARDENGRTPLLIASLGENAENIRFLLEKSTEVDAVDKANWNALHIASRFGGLQVIDVLLKSGFDVNSRTTEGITPLMLAAYRDEELFDKILLQNNTDNDARDNHGNTALHYAAKWGNVTVLQKLLDQGANIESRGESRRTPLLEAALGEKSENVEFLLQKGAKLEAVDIEEWNALHCASRYGSLQVMEVLLQSGLDVNARTKQGITPSLLAIFRADELFVKVLAQNNADILAEDNHGRTALHYAAQQGNVAIMKTLLDLGADLEARDENGRTPLLIASQGENAENIRFLLEKSTEVDAVDTANWNALHIASRFGGLQVIDVLLKRGFDVNSRTKGGITPLMLAAARDEELFVNALLKNNAEILAVDYGGATSLHFAAQWGNVAILKTLLDQGANLEAKDGNGRTPLMLAVQGEKVENVIFLLQLSPDVGTVDVYGQNALHYASRFGSFQVLEILLKCGFDVTTRTKDGTTPLMLAAQRDEVLCVNVLLQNNAPVYVEDSDGMTAIHHAIKWGTAEVMEMLLDNGSNLEARGKEGDTPLLFAAQNDKLECAELLISRGAKIDVVNSYGMGALHVAAQFGSLEMIEFFLSKGFDLNSPAYDGETPLISAADGGKIDNFQFLLERGANINVITTNGRTLLHAASFGGSSDLIELILNISELDIEAQMNDGKSPLLYAAQCGKVDLVTCLWNRGANVEAVDKYGRNALHYLVKFESKEIMQMLLNKGVSLEYRTKDGKTPLLLAARMEKAENVMVLLQNGADIEAVEKNSWSALHLASRYGSLQVMEVLLKCGFGVNARTKHLETPLMLAVSEGKEEKVRMLLEKGADVHAVDEDGNNALYYAILFKQNNCAEMLLEVSF